MPETLDGFPFWVLEFNKDATPVDAAAVQRFPSELKSEGISDLFIFSHGWNNDHAAAKSLYQRFFAEVARLFQDANVPKKIPGAKIGVTGVLWPSILWPDDAPTDGPQPELPRPAGGGSVALVAAKAKVPIKKAEPKDINTTLKRTYDDARQQQLIDELTAMLEEQPADDAAINAFRTKLGELLASEHPGRTDKEEPDDAERGIVDLNDRKWRQLLVEVGNNAEKRGSAKGGAVGLGDPFTKLWDGAKDVLRIATYWQMKNRAGVVGRDGLGKVLGRLPQDAPDLRVHLLGHSFGARLVSFALSGLPATMTQTKSPVKSLFLLQGAFSHYAFADELPHDRTRSGALKGMAARVDGPLLTTQSLRDYAVGVSYPAASMVNNEDAAAFDNPSARWGAMGHDGAQAVKAPTLPLSAPRGTYPFSKGGWMNLDGNEVIIHGSLPSGAHSDIVHPHTAWAALAAAGIV
jgi:hypothetical protein